MGMVEATSVAHCGHLLYPCGDVFSNGDKARGSRNRHVVEFALFGICCLLSRVSLIDVVLYAREYTDYKNFNMYFLILPNYRSPTLLEVMQNKQLFTVLR